MGAFFRPAATLTFLFQDRFAQIDAFAADIDVARSFDERPDFSMAFAAERAVRALFALGVRSGLSFGAKIVVIVEHNAAFP